MQEPSCFRPGTTPSLIFAIEANMINHIDYLPGLGNSDHICICFHLSCYSTYKPNQTPRYNVNRANFDNMHEALYTVNWLDIMEPMNTQEAWEFFKTVIQDIIDKYIPTTTGVQKIRNTYMSPEAFRIKKLKRKLWKTIPCLRLTMITKLLRKLEISLDVLHEI